MADNTEPRRPGEPSTNKPAPAENAPAKAEKPVKE